MKQKSVNFFEQHIEKIVLAMVGLACLFLLVTRVILSSSHVTYDNKTFLPSEIDDYIYNEQALQLERMLDRKVDSTKSYDPKLPDFLALMNSAVHSVDTRISIPQPIVSPKSLTDNRSYPLPAIGEVTDVAVEHIRTVAYIPTETVNEEKTYEMAENEPNDLDFITVEAKFEVSSLSTKFYECFAGDDLKPQWRDPCLAEPVFAAVELQRQQLLEDGSWTDWQVLPRTKIDSSRATLRVIENAQDLPVGGIKVRLLTFNESLIQKNILQPDPYQIASAKDEWLPPLLHKKYTEQVRSIEAQERRDALSLERAEQERERATSDRRTRTTRSRPTTPITGSGGGDDSEDAGFSGGTTAPRVGGRSGARRSRDREAEARRTAERRTQRTRESAPENPFETFQQIQILPTTDFARMREPLVFWAHDDTAEPENSYRYRIRLGVFNPVAGLGQVDDEYESKTDQVVLWSNFSPVTDTVTIPAKMYFFPTDIQEALKIVTVQVSKYVLGYWYSKEFSVRQGEVIGETAETDPLEDTVEGVTIPQRIDYFTDLVLVDTVPVNDWSGTKNLYPRKYFNMLYTSDGVDIKSEPIKTRYWVDSRRFMYNEIKRAEKEPKEPLREFASVAGPRFRTSTSSTISDFYGQPGGGEEEQ